MCRRDSWCIVQLEYESEGDSNFGITDIDGQPISSKQKKQKDISPISIHKLTPIQMPHVDIEEVREGRKAFTQEEWMDVMLRSCGYAVSYTHLDVYKRQRPHRDERAVQGGTACR